MNEFLNFHEIESVKFKIDAKSIDNFADLSGHKIFIDNNTNFYFWGKDPIGGGTAIFGSHRTVQVIGLEQGALVMTSSNDVELSILVRLNCECRTEQNLSVGWVDLSSGKYTHLGSDLVNGYTNAVFSDGVKLRRGQSFILAVWQETVGDSIEIYGQRHPNWKSTVSFS